MVDLPTCVSRLGQLSLFSAIYDHVWSIVEGLVVKISCFKLHALLCEVISLEGSVFLSIPFTGKLGRSLHWM